jgi:hypothetical protein
LGTKRCIRRLEPSQFSNHFCSYVAAKAAEYTVRSQVQLGNEGKNDSTIA